MAIQLPPGTAFGPNGTLVYQGRALPGYTWGHGANGAIQISLNGTWYTQTGIANGSGIWSPVGGGTDPNDPNLKVPDINVPTFNPGGSSFGGFGTSDPVVLTTVTGRKLTQSQYNALVSDYKHLGLRYGRTISDAQAKKAATMDLSSDEFMDRLQALNLTRDNKSYFSTLKTAAKDNGLKLDDTDILQSLVGAKPVEFYKTYQELALRVSASQAGIKVTEKQKNANLDTEISRKDLLSITHGEKDYLTNTSALGKTLEDYALAAIQLLPESRLRGIGVSKKQLYQVVAGKGSAMAQDQVDRLAATVDEQYKVKTGQAFTGNQAPQLRNQQY